MLIDPKAIRWTAIITLYVAAAVILFEGLGSEKQFLQRTSWIPAAIVVALTIYEHWLWKVGPFGIPVLDGTWKAVLTSNWRKNETTRTQLSSAVGTSSSVRQPRCLVSRCIPRSPGSLTFWRPTCREKETGNTASRGCIKTCRNSIRKQARCTTVPS